MTDTSTATPPTPPPQPAAPAPSFPPMPRNAAGAFGFLGNYLGNTNPVTLAGHALILVVGAVLVGFLSSVIPGEIVVLDPTLRMIASLCEGVSLVVLIVAAARFIADAVRARG